MSESWCEYNRKKGWQINCKTTIKNQDGIIKILKRRKICCNYFSVFLLFLINIFNFTILYAFIIYKFQENETSGKSYLEIIYEYYSFLIGIFCCSLGIIFFLLGKTLLIKLKKLFPDFYKDYKKVISISINLLFFSLFLRGF